MWLQLYNKMKAYLPIVTIYLILISGASIHKADPMNEADIEEHDYVIIGAGIAGLQAALILAEFEKDFVLVEATGVAGGRIGTETLGEILNKEVNNPNAGLKQLQPQWIRANPNLLNVPIEYGATWIAEQHQYMHNLLKMLKIEQFPQFKKGDTIYGVEPGRYQPFESHYNKDKRQIIEEMLDKIEKLKNKYTKLYEQAIQKQYKDKYPAYKQFIDKYDTISVKQFIESQIKDKTISGEVMNFIECLQCIGCEKFSMMQLIDDSDSLAIVYESIGDQEGADDGFRVRTGMASVVRAMVGRLMGLVKEYMDDVKLEDIIRFYEPVTKIQTWKDKNSKQCKTHTNGPNGPKTYLSRRVLNSIPLATLHRVNITNLSQGKKLIFNGQENGIVCRTYMIFKSPFWRGEYNGYGSFSPKFPFSEMTDISPAGNQCGILAFVCYGGKYAEWLKRMPDAGERFRFLKSVVADMFLKGDRNSPLLNQSITYMRTFTGYEYIGAAYQPTTKIGVWKAVEDSGEEYGESFETDENGVHYIGSEFDEEFGSYMEGALRITRKKVFQLISKSDPWYK